MPRSDRQAARRSLDALLSHQFDRVVVGHGAPLGTQGRELIAAAYTWLPESVRWIDAEIVRLEVGSPPWLDLLLAGTRRAGPSIRAHSARLAPYHRG